MKDILIIFVSVVTISCNSAKAITSGNWEYKNENGELKTLIIDKNRWISDYCFLRFPDSSEWDCNQINTKIKLIGNNKIKLIFDDSKSREFLIYDIVEITDSKLVLKKYSNDKTYSIKYLRAN